MSAQHGSCFSLLSFPNRILIVSISYRLSSSNLIHHKTQIQLNTMSTNVLCEGGAGCNQTIVAKCMHCDNHLCLQCLTRHQQPIDTQLFQLTNDMNKLLLLSSIELNDDDDNDNKQQQSNHPQNNVNKQYLTVMEEIDYWQMTMTKKLNDLVGKARQRVRDSYEQISFEIEEWSTDKQIEIQQLASDIGNYLFI